MRVLCLHDHGSCAMHMHATLNCLEERLWNQHGIELVFANSPLSCTRKQRVVENKFQCAQQEEVMNQMQDLSIITSPVKKRSCRISSNENNNDIDSQKKSSKPNTATTTSRCWWEETDDKHVEDKEEKRDKWVGLDASIFHLRQLWTTLPQSSNIELEYSPFVGILGIGQGAALAAILALLSNSSSHNVPFLDGLEFAIFIKGYDLIQSTDMPKTVATKNNNWFEGEPPVCTLHMTLPSQLQNHSSKVLYESFGGNTYPHQTQLYILGSKTNQKRNNKRRLAKSTTTTSARNAITTREPIDTINIQDLNVLGRYIVQQKNKWSQQQRKKNSIPSLNFINKNINTQSSVTGSEKNNGHSNRLESNIYSGDPLSLNESFDKENKDINERSDFESENKTTISLEETKMKIQSLERYALEQVLPRAIAANPPKALIATIFQPSLTGAWTGGNKDIDRSTDFIDSGGAPCPSSFVLPKEER